ncbi:hypothetical protein SELMODRAFT_110192 [Selaginella moellendorffii]|uniref:Growth arrest-specific protein 8 domain-containing protein n=2 Tax=Selaginella moellendorffii TaxID=88036 RepID=D8S7S3_SELML|nr:hypothetical protein SELMODRAFT_110192 [Selaginella moellendorffii]
MAPKGKEHAPAVEEAPAAPSTQELEGKIRALNAEKEKEERARNRVQIERDKLNTFYELKKKEVDQCKAELFIKDHDIQGIEERHRVQMQVFNQKTRHLQYEQQGIIGAVKGDNEIALKLFAEQAATREHQLLDEQRLLKSKIREVELGYEDTIRQLKLDHAKEISMIRQEYDAKAKDLVQSNERKCKKIEEDSELRKKQEVHEIEERKNQHIIELMKKHEKAFADIKFYYNDITQNNLDLIKTLKEDITDMKKKEQANEKFMYEIAQENKHSMEPLTKALKELDVLRKHIQLLNFNQDRQALQQLRVHYADTLEQIKHLEWQYRSLQEKMDKAKQAILHKDDLYARFESCIFDVQQKCGLKSMLLEKKLHVVQEQLEKKEAQLGESLAGKLQPGKVDYKFDKVLETKNQQIKSLYYELGRVTKAHDSIVKAFEVKLAALGIPLQEMGLPYYLSKIQL